MKLWSNTLLCAVMLVGCATSKLVKFDAPEKRETVMLLLDRHGKVEQRMVAAWREQDKKWASLNVYDAKGVLLSRIVYSPSGMVAETQFFDAGGTLRGRAQVDESGHRGRVEIFDKKGEPISIPCDH